MIYQHQAAFEDLWRDLKQGRPWRGIIKNWSKDGGYCWVDANVSPVRDKDRNIAGFQSVRFKPSDKEIDEANEAYQKINVGNKKLYISHGRVFQKQPIKNFLLSNAVQWLIIAALAMTPALLQLFNKTNTWVALLAVTLLPVAIGFIAHRRYRTTQTLINWIDVILAQGNLKTPKPKQTSSDRQLAILGNSIEDFTRSIRATIKGVDDIAVRVTEAAQESQQVVQHVVTVSQTQSEASASSATAIEEMSHSIVEVSKQTEQTKAAVESAGQEARLARSESHPRN